MYNLTFIIKFSTKKKPFVIKKKGKLDDEINFFLNQEIYFKIFLTVILIFFRRRY